MVSEETMMFRFGNDENKAERIIRSVCKAMEEKGYNPINQLVGYLLSGDPAYITSHNDARSLIRTLERDELLEELVRSYLDKEKEKENKE
ncbi:IreB family regulatory phosphoprotein [Mitsuokella sp. AF21-1AC]|uniref:IreB family regulatory phosphoprotein n=1 Tax=Mitsuokella sp. AF21-1AC TaxID=2292235 RepID=UPI000E4A980B|nr:IreB family regulatory phosphoprotein [Mitsuokella sp. AF21-1AC]RGS70920.1 IreB family regulatory phosphoprotein [Mitsuokella sp. AF21-1AC]